MSATIETRRTTKEGRCTVGRGSVACSRTEIARAFRSSRDGEDVDDVSDVWWRRMVKSQTFDLVCGVLIFANAVVMALELEYKGIQAGVDLGIFNRRVAEWPQANIIFAILEHTFAIIFIIELCLRIATYGCEYFRETFNWIDLITVVTSILELYVFALLDIPMLNVSFIRLLRLLKLIKVLRFVRVMKLFTQLRVLVSSIAASVGALAWSIVFLTVIQGISAIFLTQVLLAFIEDDGEALSTRNDAHHYFGTWTNSMLTLYQMTLAPGAWGPIGRLLIFKVNAAFWLFFIPDGSGQIDYNEFQQMLEKPFVRAWLSVLELDVADLNMVFAILDDGDGVVSFEEFIQGVLKMRGGAKGVDVFHLIAQSQKIMGHIEEMRKYIDKELGRVTKLSVA